MNTQARRHVSLFAFTATLAAAMFSTSLAAQAPSAVEAQPAAGTPTPQLVAENTTPSLPAAEVTSDVSSSAASTLPDAPSATMSGETTAATAFAGPFSGTPGHPWKYAKYIPPGSTVAVMSGGDKFKMALGQMVSPLSLTGSVISAGYSHITNAQPNYGTNSTAFGQRVGASIARGSAQELFSDGILAPILHMDPRYYVVGDSKSIIPRAWYAATRVLVGKTDSGRKTINAPLLLGYVGAAGLNFAYYPQINRDFKDAALGYGGSVGGAALGFVFSEFADDLLRAIHLRAH